MFGLYDNGSKYETIKYFYFGMRYYYIIINFNAEVKINISI